MDEIYKYLFKYYKRKNDEASSNDLYRTALSRKRDIECITELMYDYYKEKRNYLKQKEMLLKLVQCADSRVIKKWYQRCKDELSEKDFIENENLLGNAYEYLIGQFAAGSGKKAGEFYTPQQISTILSRIVILDSQNPSASRRKYASIPYCIFGIRQGRQMQA